MVATHFQTGKLYLLDTSKGTVDFCMQLATQNISLPILSSSTILGRAFDYPLITFCYRTSLCWSVEGYVELFYRSCAVS